jgi:DNA polymerase-3 subunit delta
MKIKEAEFSNLIKTKLANVPALLIYGPDDGKNREFAAAIAKALDVPADNIVAADGAAFRDKFDAIYADACSASMFGGNKLVIVDHLDGRDLALLKSLCESALAPVVVLDDELDAKSTLRSYFEESEKCAALPLYADGDQAIGAIIRKTLADYGITNIEGDALAYMLQHLGKDRAVAKSFLEKIALYVGAAGATVTLDDVEKCLPDSGAASMDEFKHNLSAGNIMQALRAMDRLFSENVNAAQMVRALGNHFKDLLSCVVGGQMPRVFYKYERLFDAARKIWDGAEISSVLIKINRLESDTRGNMDPELAFRDFSLKLATRAYKLASVKKKK